MLWDDVDLVEMGDAVEDHRLGEADDLVVAGRDPEMPSLPRPVEFLDATDVVEHCGVSPVWPVQPSNSPAACRSTDARDGISSGSARRMSYSSFPTTGSSGLREALEEAVAVPLRPRRPIGHGRDDREVELAEVFGRLAIDRLARSSLGA